ncbi:hypothetical protein V6N12_018836 [Hibiscus sabdariffa]|uniref:Uncharacterized protein n=1 Tax=Hibiscus sabdariffa TaxID=183260 RepID=A0ABR2A6L0_9ROSI
MENPDGLENPSVVTSLNTDITTAGSYRGRQPNLVINVEGPTCLERSGSPLATEIQHFHKKGRSLVVTESDVTMGDGAVAQIGVLVREPLVVANSGSVGAVFGPWMQAPSHRRRNAPLKKDVGSGNNSILRSGGSGSRFSVIADVQDSDVVDEDVVHVHHSSEIFLARG